MKLILLLHKFTDPVARQLKVVYFVTFLTVTLLQINKSIEGKARE